MRKSDTKAFRPCMVALLALSALLPVSVCGQAGSLDPTFVYTGTSEGIEGVALQPDGKILVGSGGGFLTRILPSGSGDTNFYASRFGGPFGGPRVFALQPDGKILVGGPNRSFARLAPDGRRDADFKWPEASGEGECTGIVVQPDGKIVVSFGGFSWFQSGHLLLGRLHPDGTLDVSFRNEFLLTAGDDGPRFYDSVVKDLPTGELLWTRAAFGPYSGWSLGRFHGDLSYTLTPSGGFSSRPRSFFFEADDILYVAGEFGLTRSRNGTRDERFLPSFDGPVNAIAVAGDGKPIVGGAFTTVNGTKCGPLARLLPNGSLDLSFVSALTNLQLVSTLNLTGDSKLLIGGRTSSNGLWRLNLDSGAPPHITQQPSLLGGREAQTARLLVKASPPGLSYQWLADSGPVRDGTNALLVISNLTLAHAGTYQVVISNEFGSIASSNVLLQVEPTRASPGHLLTNFASGTGANAAIRTVARQADGRLIIGGEFTAFDSVPRHGIARLHVDGSLDHSFAAPALSNTYPSQPVVHSVVVLPDQRILVGGGFVSIGGEPRKQIARLLSNGELDPSFDAGTNVALGPNGWVSVVRVQSDGKIMTLAHYRGSYPRIARLLPDGALDESFSLPGNRYGSYRALELDPQDRIVLSDASAVRRFLPNGNNDLTLNVYSVTALAVTTNSEILLARGEGSGWVGIYAEDGTLQGSFSPTNPPNFVRAIAQDSAGFIHLSGYFGTKAPLRRFRRTGQPDTVFGGRLEIDGYVWAVLPEADGSVLIAGEFSQVNAVPRGRIAKVRWTLPLRDPQFAPTGFRVTADAEPNARYYLEAREPHPGAAWTTLSSLLTAPTGSVAITFQDPAPTNHSRMYRVRY